MQQQNKLIYILYKIEDFVLLLCLTIMGITLFLQVIFRYIFNFPLIWSEELARYLHVWITFLGLGYGIKNKAHIKVEFFYNKLGEKMQKIIKILMNIFLIFCFLFFMPGTMRFLSNQDLILSSAMEVKMSIVYVVLPIGIIISILHFLVDSMLLIVDLTKNNCIKDSEGRV